MRFSNLLTNIIFLLIITLFLTLPFINARLFELINIPGFDLLVKGNYEFTKTIFFNIYSTGIILFYGLLKITEIGTYKYPEKSQNYFFYFLGIFWSILLLSTIFADSFFQSFFGDNSKHHGFFMWNNLIMLCFIFYDTLNKKIFKIINKAIVLSALGVALIGIKEYFIPSFDYGNLSNRLLSTFGHPNYVALLFLLILPYITHKIFDSHARYKQFGYAIMWIIISGAFLLTKSAFALFLYFIYLGFFLYKKTDYKKTIFYSFSVLFLIVGFSIFYYFPEKLHSLISRIYIWETTLRIIFSELKILIIGIGAENLVYYFDSFKSPYLYIFENYGFTADRPHNLLLQFFVFHGILGFLLISFLYFYTFRKIEKFHHTHYSLLLGLTFLLLNFASVACYIIIALYFCYSVKFHSSSHHQTPFYFKYFEKYKYILIAVATLFSIININYSLRFYIAETYAYQENYGIAAQYYPFNPEYYYKSGNIEQGLKIEGYSSEDYYIAKIIYDGGISQACSQLVKHYPSSENFFYCGKILENFGYLQESTQSYLQGLQQFPDLWNRKSKYYSNIFVDTLIDGKRFFSEKYSPIKQVLQKVSDFGEIYYNTNDNQLKQ